MYYVHLVTLPIQQLVTEMVLWVVIKRQLEVPQPILTKEQMEQINFTLIEALHINKQVYLTYYKNGQRITETGFIQFVDSLGNLFIFINEVFELKNKMRLSELINVRFA